MAEGDKKRIWGGYKHDADGKRTGKATAKEIKAAGGGGLTANEKDRVQAQALAKGQAAPYRKAAEEVQADIDAGMSDADIAKKYGAAYGVAGTSAAAYAPALAASSANVGSLIGGLASMLPGGSTDYGITSMLTGIKDEVSSNSFLAGLYADAAATDVRSAAAVGISGAEARRDARAEDLRKEQRGYIMQGDVIQGDYLSQMKNVLGIRSDRANLALAKLNTEAQRLANEKTRKGGSGSGSSTVTPPAGETEEEEKARLKAAADAKKLRETGARQSNYGLDGLIGSYSDTYNLYKSR